MKYTNVREDYVLKSPLGIIGVKAKIEGRAKELICNITPFGSSKAFNFVWHLQKSLRLQRNKGDVFEIKQKSGRKFRALIAVVF